MQAVQLCYAFILGYYLNRNHIMEKEKIAFDHPTWLWNIHVVTFSNMIFLMFLTGVVTMHVIIAGLVIAMGDVPSSMATSSSSDLAFVVVVFIGARSAHPNSYMMTYLQRFKITMFQVRATYSKRN